MSNTKVALGYVGTDNTVRPDVEGLYRLIFVPDDGPYLLGKTPEDDIKLAPVINKGTISGDNISVEGGENNALGNVMLSLPQSVAPEASPTFAGLTVTGNVSGITKSMIGLGNVDNTPDAEKPVSRAQREEINKKGDFRTVIYYSELQTLVAANNFIGDVLVNFDSTNDGEPTRYFVNLDKKILDTNTRRLIINMKSLNVNINNEFLSTIKKEGRYRVANSWSSQPPIRGTSNANTAVSGSVDQYPTPGKHAFLESVLVTSDRDCIVAVNIRQPFELGTSEGQYFYFLINSLSTTLNSTIVIPLNILVRDGGRFSVFVQKNDTGETPEVSSTFIMTEFAADLNFEAQKSILFCGDSTTWYGLGNDNSGTVFDGQNLFPFLLRDKMIDASGKTHRVINKGFGGSTARDWRKALRAGEIDGIKYDLLVVNLGLNDAIIISGNYTVSLYKECLADFIQRRDRYNPKAKILFLGANVSDTSNRQMYLSVIRSAMDELVIEKGGNEKGLYYIDKSQAFGLNAIAINDTNFVNSERLSGQRVHPGGNGNLLIAEYIFSQSEDWISKL